MKKAIFTILLSLLMVVSLNQTTLAEGYHLDTTVYVYPTWMSGGMNNRWNTTPTVATTYISAAGYADPDSTISFAGRDGDGEYFYCFVPSTSPFYQGAREIKNSLTNGGHLFVSRPATSSECDSVYLLNASQYLN